MAAQIVLSIMVLVLASASAQATSILTNGSFELASLGDTAPTNTFRTLTAGTGYANDIDGWLVTSGSVDWICTLWKPEDGLRSLDLSGSAAGTIAASTAMVTTPNSWYEVTFWMSGNPAGTRGDKKLQVQTESSTSPVFIYSTATEGNTSGAGGDMKWKEEVWSFQATSSLTTLSFVSLTNTNIGPALDNVSVVALPGSPGSAVPEPVTLAGVFLGIGGLAGYVRRRRMA
jgi:choice-of-anchor C domain-containing protein